TAPHRFWPVENVSGQGHTTGPMISPVGWRRLGFILMQRCKAAKTARRMGCVKSNFGKCRDRNEAQVRTDEPQRVWQPCTRAPRVMTGTHGRALRHIKLLSTTDSTSRRLGPKLRFAGGVPLKLEPADHARLAYAGMQR